MVDRADVEVEAEEKMSDIEVAARIMLRIDGVVTQDIDRSWSDRDQSSRRRSRSRLHRSRRSRSRSSRKHR